MWHFGFFLFCFSSKPCITSSTLFTLKSVFRIILMLYDRANCFSAFWFSVKRWTWLPFDPLSQPKQPKPNQLFTHSWLHSGIIFQIISVQSDKKIRLVSKSRLQGSLEKRIRSAANHILPGLQPPCCPSLVLLGGETILLHRAICGFDGFGKADQKQRLVRAGE